jgi:predicted transposase/invertase (TIGR01784 family)
MQKARPSHFAERVLLQHSAFLLQSKYEWDQSFGDLPPNPTEKERASRDNRRYEIPPTYAIWICDFKVKLQDGYFGTWAFRNDKGLTVTDKVMYIMYDLTQFTKTYEEIETDEERWLYLLKHAGKADSLPDFGDPVIAKAIERLLVKNVSEKSLKEQASDMVMTEEELDYLAALKVKARSEGHAEGLEEGRSEGRSEERREMATNMLADGEPIEKIVKYSHLSEAEVLAIKASHEH